MGLVKNVEKAKMVVTKSVRDTICAVDETVNKVKYR